MRADKRRDGVLLHRAPSLQLLPLRACGLELRLGTRQVQARSDAGRMPLPHQFGGAGVSRFAVAQQHGFVVQSTQGQQRVGQLRLQRQACCGQIGFGGLGFGHACVNALAHTAPEVHFVRQRQAERGAVVLVWRGRAQHTQGPAFTLAVALQVERCTDGG